jgi:hypothetical protein
MQEQRILALAENVAFRSVTLMAEKEFSPSAKYEELPLT